MSSVRRSTRQSRKRDFFVAEPSTVDTKRRRLNKPVAQLPTIQEDTEEEEVVFVNEVHAEPIDVEEEVVFVKEVHAEPIEEEEEVVFVKEVHPESDVSDSEDDNSSVSSESSESSDSDVDELHSDCNYINNKVIVKMFNKKLDVAYTPPESVHSSIFHKDNDLLLPKKLNSDYHPWFIVSFMTHPFHLETPIIAKIYPHKSIENQYLVIEVLRPNHLQFRTQVTCEINTHHVFNRIASIKFSVLPDTVPVEELYKYLDYTCAFDTSEPTGLLKSFIDSRDITHFSVNILTNIVQELKE